MWHLPTSRRQTTLLDPAQPNLEMPGPTEEPNSAQQQVRGQGITNDALAPLQHTFLVRESRALAARGSQPSPRLRDAHSQPPCGGAMGHPTAAMHGAGPASGRGSQLEKVTRSTHPTEPGHSQSPWTQTGHKDSTSEKHMQQQESTGPTGGRPAPGHVPGQSPASALAPATGSGPGPSAGCCWAYASPKPLRGGEGKAVCTAVRRVSRPRRNVWNSTG